MTLRRLLAALILLTLIGGHPTAAPVSGAQCQTVAAPADGCCGTGDMPSCALACSAAPAAVGEASAQVQPSHGGAPLAAAACNTRSFTLPPDTAPPKILSA